MKKNRHIVVVVIAEETFEEIPEYLQAEINKKSKGEVITFHGKSLIDCVDDIEDIQPNVMVLAYNGHYDLEEFFEYARKERISLPQLITYTWSEGAFREIKEYDLKTIWIQRTHNLEEDAKNILQAINT